VVKAEKERLEKDEKKRLEKELFSRTDTKKHGSRRNDAKKIRKKLGRS